MKNKQRELALKRLADYLYKNEKYFDLIICAIRYGVRKNYSNNHYKFRLVTNNYIFHADIDGMGMVLVCGNTIKVCSGLEFLKFTNSLNAHSYVVQRVADLY